jgi:hypothetical protein
MKPVNKLLGKLELLLLSLAFLRKHYTLIILLGLIAAFGRVIQLKGFGEIPAWANVVLEIIVESSRLIMILFVLGIANVKEGALLVKRVFTEKGKLKAAWTMGIRKLKTRAQSIVISFIGFSVIATVLNVLINQLAYQTCLFLSLKQQGILVDAASEWTILLFFKNILVIPFTLVFETLFLLWITNKLKRDTNMPASVPH